ncbi:MAG: hypothetical protein C4293_09130 [Nitrospiraceae bacterium]
MEIGIGLWILLAIAVGLLASHEFGRSGVVWFFLALFFAPLAGLLLFVLPARRPCPFCAEFNRLSAVACRFCGREVSPELDHPCLPGVTRAALLMLLVAVLLTALSQCRYRVIWWRSDAPVEVSAPSIEGRI